MEMPTKQRIADLRREIEGIRELNRLYRAQKYHSSKERIAYDHRMVKLQAIIAELRTSRRTNTDGGR